MYRKLQIANARESRNEQKCELNHFQQISMDLISGSDSSSSATENVSTAKVKHRLWSLWNNVKYGWMVKLRANFNPEQPIWLLGVCYTSKLIENTDVCSISLSSKTSCQIKPRSNSITSTNSVLTQIQAVNRQVQHTASIISESCSSLCDAKCIFPFPNTPTLRATLVNCDSPALTLEKFKHDLYSRLWMTYRSDFTRLTGSHFTSDAGWGCMIRSAQMMFAQALLCHFLSRHWRWSGVKSDKEDMIHRMLVKWFADFNSSIQCPFSIHQLVRQGVHLGKKPGDWYGPASVSYMLKDALCDASKRNFVLDGLCVYVAQDCTVYVKDIVELCTSRNRDFSLTEQSSLNKENSNGSFSKRKGRRLYKNENDRSSEDNAVINKRFSNDRALEKSYALSRSYCDLSSRTENTFVTPERCKKSNESYSESESHSSSSTEHTARTEERWKSVVILVPMRLGGEKFNVIYVDVIRKLFFSQMCIGIIGGRPKHSLYFIGCQEDKLIYLDPHYNQEKVDVMNSNNFPLDSYHCSVPRKMPISRIDPSCTIAFYCKTKEDFYNLIQFTRNELRPYDESKKSLGYPIFHFDDGSAFNNEDSIKSQSLATGDKEVDEFVML